MDHVGYFVRVDALEGYGEKLKMLVACEDYKSIVAVQHHGTSKENKHYHFVVQTEVAGQAFRVRMRKIFDQGKGNGHMSIKPWDGNNDAIAYMFHEDEDAVLLVQHNVSDETINECRERNRQVCAMVQASKAKAAWHLEEIVYQLLQKEKNCSEADIGQQLILQALRCGKYVPQPWQIRAMAERIMFRRLNGDVESEETFAMRLSRQIFYRE